MRPLPRIEARAASEDGNALVEFVYLAVVLMIPLVYVLLSVFQVQRAAFGVTEAARQAGRAYVLAPTAGTGRQRADTAASLALADQGIHGAPAPEISCPGGCRLQPGSTVEVSVSYRVRLPVLSLLLPGDRAPSIPVRARHLEVVDTYQAAP